MALEDYKKKRDFSRTPEPPGEKRPDGGFSYCIQKHAASRLHYDFRLEWGGVLLSWAVPKGPSFDPRDKRLAMHVEDHPVDYGSFEGVIPEGEYGAGAVVLWDRGTWKPVLEPSLALKKGELKFELFGEKLRGRWALVKIKGDDPKVWLLVKDKDEHARSSVELDIVSARPESVVSGRGLAEVAAERDRLWHSRAVGPGGEIDPGGPAEGDGGARLAPGGPRGCRACGPASHPAAGPGDDRGEPARRRRVAPRDQTRRLPDRGAHRGRRSAARLTQRQGLDQGVPASRARRRPAAGGHAAPRRRGRRGAAERGDELPGAPAPQRGSGSARLLRLRPAAPRRLGPARRAARRAQGGAAAAPRIGARDPALQRPRARPGPRVLREGAPGRPRGHREQARRRSLSRRARRRLAQGEVPPDPGDGDRRLDAAVGRPSLDRGAPRGLPRGRAARVRGQGRLRLQRAPARRPAAAARGAQRGTAARSPTFPPRCGAAPTGSSPSSWPRSSSRSGPTRAGCASRCSSACATTATRGTSCASSRARSRAAASTPSRRAGPGRRCASTRRARAPRAATRSSTCSACA